MKEWQGSYSLEIVEEVNWEEQKEGEIANSSDFPEKLKGGDTQPWLSLDQAETKRNGNECK